MQRYRKKPVVIEAARWDPEDIEGATYELVEAPSTFIGCRFESTPGEWRTT